MEKIWANRLIAGDKKWSDIPEKRREAVKAELQARLDNGEISEELFNTICNKDGI